jgi:hypothetical protein
VVFRSIVSVTRLEHGGESGRLRFAPFPRAGFLKAATLAKLLQGLFAIQLLFEPPDRFLHRLAAFQSYLSHNGLYPAFE